jgi:hypothetical protein
VEARKAITFPGRPLATALQTAAVVGACAAVITGCSPSSGSKPLSESRVANSASTSAAQVPGRRGYLAARKEWLDEGDVIGGADQGLPLARAVTDLEHGEAADSGERSQYQAVIAALKNFMSIPDTEDTPAQDARARADAMKIDKFFHLRGNRACTNWPSTRLACWEPAGERS